MHLQPTDALLVIDVQNDFMPGGALPVAGGDAIVPLINSLAKKFDHVILTQLQQWVASHNASAVASLVHYPIKVNPGKKPFTVKNEKAFIKDYDRIITHDIQDAILKQKYENLFVNSQGAMIGDGEVWITGFCRDKSCKQSDIKIGTIQDTKNLKP